jgi:hypothetical protein
MMPDMPVHLGEEQEAGTIRLSGGVFGYPVTAMNARVDSHSKVNAQGVLQIDTEYSGSAPVYHLDNNDTYDFYGSNFHAAYPQYSLNGNFDIAFSRHASIVGGIQYSTLNHNTYNAEYLGVGLTSADSESALRADFGWRLTTSRFTVDYVIVTTPFDLMPVPNESTVEFGSATAQSQNINFYCSLVLNTTHRGSPINFFIRGGLVRQSQFDYPYRRNDAYNVEYTAALISFTPGIVLSLSTTTYLLAGAIFQHDVNSDDAASYRPMPMAQFEFRF